MKLLYVFKERAPMRRALSRLIIILICQFLGVPYSEIRDHALAGESDEVVLNWAHARGTPRTDEECHIWNSFIAKLGWRDERSHVLPQRIEESGLTGKPIETLIDHIEFDEGRDPVVDRAWEKI